MEVSTVAEENEQPITYSYVEKIAASKYAGRSILLFISYLVFLEYNIIRV